MSIQKRLIISNIAMIVVPILAFLLIDILIGVGIFGINSENASQETIQTFLKWRFAGLLFVIAVTNGLLTYYVSKTILKPIGELAKAAQEISGGNLDYSIKKKSNDELGQLSETFEEMRIKLKQAEERQMRYEDSRKELIASISHDLKTPITSIQGYVKGLLDGIANTPEKTVHYLQTIDLKAGDMDKLIDELFLYSKLDLQKETFHFEQLNLRTYFEDLVEELKFSLPEGEVLFQADPAKTYLVEADRDKLQRAVSNLIQNALKHVPKENPLIGIHLTAEPEQILVRIHDNGSGIPEEALPHIFDSFYRADASRNSSTGGSGLGLAITKRIIEEHGGAIWAESNAAIGTTLSFTLRKSRKA